MTPAQRPGDPVLTDAAIAVCDLHKRYGSAAVLNGLTLTITGGEIYGLMGANGAGKTTALRVICGLILSERGSGHCLNTPLGQRPLGIGYMPQRGGLYDDLTIAENLSFFAGAYGVGPEAARKALLEHNLESRTRQRVGTLSGGWRQRVALAAALIAQPKLILLDEPSAGLDPVARDALWEIIRRRVDAGAAALVTTHYVEEAERCDRIGYLREGQLLAEGAPATLGSALGLVALPEPEPEPLTETATPAIHPQGRRPRLVLRATELGSGVSPSVAATAEPARLADALNWLARSGGAA